MEEKVITRVSDLPKLITFGRKQKAKNGWSTKGVLEHLQWHLAQRPSKRWCTIDCAAATFFNKNTITGREQVRKRVALLFKNLLLRDFFLVIEKKKGPKHHEQISALKLFVANEEQEKEYAQAQLEKMKLRKEVSDELCTEAERIINSLIPAATEMK